MNSSDQLSDIASLLMLRGSFMRSLGLLNGKMGAVIFFYYYSKYSGCSRYGKFAEELLEEVYKQIYNGYPLAFADGLSGIAWAVVYLLRNGFVKADDEQELLADLDEKILEWDVRRIKDMSLEKGLLGLGHYILSRISPADGKSYLPADYVNDYVRAARHAGLEEILLLMSSIKNGTLSQQAYMSQFLSAQVAPCHEMNANGKLGIASNGAAGYGLNLILNNS
ncbi:MAG: hypothetical protein PUG09_07600 [Prevotella sp.]|nr:hypothetical protein [Prevotella sp.]